MSMFETTSFSRRQMMTAGMAILLAGKPMLTLAGEADHSHDINVGDMFVIHRDDAQAKDPIESIDISIKQNPNNDDAVTYPEYLFEMQIDVLPVYEASEKPEGLGWGWWPVEHCYVTSYWYKREEIFPRFSGYIITSGGERIDGNFIAGDTLGSNLTYAGRECFTHSTYYVEEQQLDYHWYVLSDDGDEIPVY